MKLIFQAAEYDPAKVTRRTVEFSEVSGRRPWIVREYGHARYLRGYRSEGDEIPVSAQDQAKRLGQEVAVS